MNRRRRIRIAYLAVAVVAFCLALVTADSFFIATSAFILIAAVASAVIARRQERRDVP